MSLEFTEKDILTLVTDIGIYSLSKENTKLNQIVSYYSSEFTCCDISNKGDYLVALAKYGSKNVFEINAYSSDGEKLTTISVNGEVKSSYITDKYIVILADNQILVYNFKGKLISTITYKGEPLSLLPTDYFIYIESLDRIYRCFTYCDSSLTLVS